MESTTIAAYSKLLLDYCLRVDRGSKVYIHTTTLALPLVQVLYQDILERMAIPVVNMAFDQQEELQSRYAHEEFIKYINPEYQKAIEEFDAYLFIRAPFETNGLVRITPSLQNIRRQVMAALNHIYAQRTGSYELRRTLCQYPTLSGANDAGMDLETFDQFVSNACFLNEKEPEQSWKNLGEAQQHLVDYLNKTKTLTYINSKSEISFSVDGRKWINSDGKNNMPSGEIYTSPVEDSVDGYVYFDYPFMYQHQLVQGIRLEVKNGLIQSGEAEQGNQLLQEILDIPGARTFGEAAIGLNSNISRPTKNILFDEKMAGTVHMAIGQSYLQCGGKNESAVHLNMIADMKKSGQILADGVLIYQQGKFLI